MCEHRRVNGTLPSPWGARGWKVALFTEEQLRAAIRYVEENPARAGFKRQQWEFVAPFLASERGAGDSGGRFGLAPDAN